MNFSSASHAAKKIPLIRLAYFFLNLLFFQLAEAQSDAVYQSRLLSSGTLSCTGSLGDPVVKITFGAGTGIGPSLGAGVTGMQYVGSDCPNDGEYTIINNSSGCFGGNWHTTRDHTGDANGYFMLINASFQPSDFYVQTVTGLCSGTTYRFSAFVMNMLRTAALYPDVTFTIERTDGTILGTYTTGDVPVTNPPVYNEYGFYFTTPPGINSVVLRMRNNAPGGNGNDLAIDDISFSPAGPQTRISIIGLTGDSIISCNRSVRLESLVENCFLMTDYQWQSSPDGGRTWRDIPGATGTSYTTPVLSSGTHLYRLTVAQAGNIGQSNCRINSNTFTILSPGRPQYVFDTLITRCPGSSFTLPWGVVVYSDGVYSDTAKSVNGCDSLVRNYRFRIQHVSVQNIQETICSGTSYQLPSGIRVHLPGNYVDTARTIIERCDSLITNLRLDTVSVPVISVTKSNDINCQLAVTKLTARGGVSYSWKPASTLNDPRSPDPVASPAATTTYTVQGTSINGCISESSIVVEVDKRLNGRVFSMPNAFSPNADGLNDCFGAGFMGQVSGFALSVYDRWGNKLFSTNNPAICWNGKYKGADQPAGTYIYQVRGKTICGDIFHQGFVLLLR